MIRLIRTSWLLIPAFFCIVTFSNALEHIKAPRIAGGFEFSEIISGFLTDPESQTLYTALAANNNGFNMFSAQASDFLWQAKDTTETSLEWGQSFIPANSQIPLFGKLINAEGDTIFYWMTQNNNKVCTYHLKNKAYHESVDITLHNGNAIQTPQNNSIIRISHGSSKDAIILYVYPHGSYSGDEHSSLLYLKVNNDGSIEAPVKKHISTNDQAGLISGGGGVNNCSLQSFFIGSYPSNIYLSAQAIMTNFNRNIGILDTLAILEQDEHGTLLLKSITNEKKPNLLDDPNATSNTASIIDAGQTIFSLQAINWFHTLGNEHARAASGIYNINELFTATHIPYLILNGGISKNLNATSVLKDVGGMLWAVRLDATGSIVKNIEGTPLAANWNNDHDSLGATLIGQEKLKLDITGKITQIFIIGHTVYIVLTNTTRDGETDCGIFMSQAFLNDDGVIIGWSPWERAFPSQEPSNSAKKDTPYFLAMHEATGSIIQVNAAQDIQKMVWQNPLADDTSLQLAHRVNASLNNSCTAILDLPQGVTGIKNNTYPSTSLTLFGGKHYVVFARTKKEDSNEIVHNYQNAENYKLTALPDQTAHVTSLCFSRNDQANTKGYFFAGTTQGLFAYVADLATKVGFNSQVGVGNTWDLSAFGDTWVPMAHAILTGEIIRMDADGQHVYVLERAFTQDFNFVTSLYRFLIENDLTTMEASCELLAQTGQFGFNETTFFTTFALSSITNAREAYIILGSNQGIYHSDEKTNALNGEWTPITTQGNVSALCSAKRTIDENRPAGGIHIALSMPDGFNATTSNVYEFFEKKYNQEFENNQESFGFISNLWTDGARRIIATRDTAGSDNTLSVQLTITHNDGTPRTTTTLSEFNNIHNVYWIENISALGILMVSTDKGIFTLG